MTDTNQIAVADTIVFGDSFNQHRITGYVHQARGRGDGYIDVPLVSHVEGNLYQGGCVNGVALPHEFKYVYSLYPWERYDIGPDTTLYEFALYDSLDQATDSIEGIADQVLVSLKKGPVLVHCQAGMNRSGAVAGRVLMKQGYTAKDAIALLRAKRPSQYVLSNQAFENWLLSL